MNSEATNCPVCGNPIGWDWRFCTCCGHPLVDLPSGKGIASASARIVSPIAPADLPDASGVPGRIVGVKVAHGWSAAFGYYDLHEVEDGLVAKTRRIDPARGGGRFPEGWFDEHTARLDDKHLMQLQNVLQDIRYCDIGRSWDGSTVIEPRSRDLYMRITFEDADGNLKTFDIHADAEYGRDVGSRCARDAIHVIESALGNKRVVDSLLVIHRQGPMLRVVVNAPLYLSPGSVCGTAYSVVDPESDDVLTIEVNELGGNRFLEARIYGLRDGWISHKAMFPIVDCGVVRLTPESFIWEDRWDEAKACKPRIREDSPGRDEWIIACAEWPHGAEGQIDVAPFLEGYEPFMTPGTYAASTWFEQGDGDEEAWFERPLPQKVALLDLSSPPAV